MKQEIKETEIKKFNKYGVIYAALLVMTVVSVVPLLVWFGWYGLIPWGAVFAAAVYFAAKVDRVKKENQISTYKEIVAFTEGRRLDEKETQQEVGKRPYQTVMYMIGSAAIAFGVVYMMAKLFAL